MDKTLNIFLFIISLNIPMCLLRWPEFLLVNSLSLLCTHVAALPQQSSQRRALCSYTVLLANLRSLAWNCLNYLYPFLGSSSMTIHPPSDLPTYWFHFHSGTIPLFTLSPLYSLCLFYSQAGIRHWTYIFLCLWVWDLPFLLSRVLLLLCACVCVCVLHSSANPYHSTGNIVFSPSSLTHITQSVWYFILP